MNSQHKLTVWFVNSKTKNEQYLCTAFNHRSMAACIEAIRSGVFGPMSKSGYVTEHVGPQGLRRDPLFEKVNGRLQAQIPFYVADKWQETATRVRNSRSARTARWELLPYDFKKMKSAAAELLKITDPMITGLLK